MTDVVLPDGGRLAVENRGEGPPLLLIRPLGGSLASWDPFADVLARRLHVIMYDPRGAGCSSPAPFPTTTRAMARDALAVLDALGIARASVYGLSLGSMVASWLALDAPERVAHLVLASSAIHGRMVRPGGWRRALTFASCLARSPRAADACLAKAVLSKAFRARHPGAVARIQERARMRPATHRGLVTLLGAALTHDVADRIETLEAPTLVLAGADDSLVPPATQRDLAARLRLARFALVPGAGHDVSAEAPDAVAALVCEHVSAA